VRVDCYIDGACQPDPREPPDLLGDPASQVRAYSRTFANPTDSFAARILDKDKEARWPNPDPTVLPGQYYNYQDDYSDPNVDHGNRFRIIRGTITLKGQIYCETQASTTTSGQPFARGYSEMRFVSVSPVAEEP